MLPSISPESYFTEKLYGKSKEEIVLEIKLLKKEIKKLECLAKKGFDLSDIDATDRANLKLWENYEYLEQAKIALVEAGGIYVLTKAELKEKEFEDNIPAISRIVFMIGGFDIGYVTRMLILDESQLRMEIKHSFEFDETKHIYEPQLGYSKNEVLEEIRAVHIGKWKKRYANNGILDGTQWKLEIYFSNGHKPVKIYGSNEYPFSFESFSMMMEFMGTYK